MDTTLKQISNLYTTNLLKHGDHSKSVGWKTLESQELRFRQLTSVIEDRSQPISINDYGCGYGAHLEYLLNQGYNVTTYNGYDLSSGMLTAASRHLSAFKGELNLIPSPEISTHADYSFVSGTFNVRFESSDNDWSDFIKFKIDEIHKHSIRGFSFNLLSKYVDWKEQHLFYADPCYWFDYVKSNLASRVNLFHGYPLYEWTLAAWK